MNNWQLSSITELCPLTSTYGYINGHVDNVFTRAGVSYITKVLDLIPAYEEFYANNGDFDNASMLRHFATAIVVFKSGLDQDDPVLQHAISDLFDLLPTIKQLVYENEKSEPQRLVLTEASPNQITKFKESKQ